MNRVEQFGLRKALSNKDFRKGGVKDKDKDPTKLSKSLNWLNPMFLHKRVVNQIPLNVRQFTSDIFGGDSDLTSDDLNYREKEALENARKNAEARGSSVIEYEDYQTQKEGESQYADVGGGGGSAPAKKFFDPNYSVKTTFGQIGFTKNKDGTYTYSDQYNFNDATDNEGDSGWKGWKKGVKKKGFSIYGQLRNIASNFGSEEGEGSKVNIKMQRGGYKSKYGW
jgi:hypothetical protein